MDSWYTVLDTKRKGIVQKQKKASGNESEIFTVMLDKSTYFTKAT